MVYVFSARNKLSAYETYSHGMHNNIIVRATGSPYFIRSSAAPTRGRLYNTVYTREDQLLVRMRNEAAARHDSQDSYRRTWPCESYIHSLSILGILEYIICMCLSNFGYRIHSHALSHYSIVTMGKTTCNRIICGAAI